MGWIKNRIDAEYGKHKTLDWSKIAEVKIISTINSLIEEWGVDKGEELDRSDLKELKEYLYSRSYGGYKK